ncbi:hypothetical protein BJV82DRAFT_85096 [Fennellomyces sp. T-0311]|nr:hypothetical protein BJV82DRAFT_85096 [Fennellomyces sp. T-0311]
MEEDQRRRPPRAVNIIRPSSPLLQAFRRPYFFAQHEPSATPSITTAGSMTSSSTWSSSSSSILSTEQPTAAGKFNGLIHNRPGSPFVRSQSPTGWSVLSKNMPYRALSPLGHHYTPLSRIAALSSMSTDSTDDDLDDSDDDISPDVSSSSDEDDEPEVVAKMKKGCTIMNGKGEFVTINEEPSPKDNNGGAKLSRKV